MSSLTWHLTHTSRLVKTYMGVSKASAVTTDVLETTDR